MKDSNVMCLFKITVLNDEKDSFLNYLSRLNMVHIKENKKTKIKERITEKNSLEQKVRKLRENLNSFFNKLGISEITFQDYKIKPELKSKFKVKDLNELINHIVDELNFFINRNAELERYIARAKIELETLTLIKTSHVFLERFNLKRSSLSVFKHLDFKVFSTFSKNMDTLNRLLNISEFPNVYQTSQVSDESIVFYVIYPKDHEFELKKRINIIHAEEVPILKKYLTTEGINFTRIVKEIEIVENTLAKNEKELRKIKDDNLNKFAAFNEIVKNIEQYLWAEQQFEEFSSQYSIIEFYAPLKAREKLIYGLDSKYKEKIKIESKILAKHPIKIRKTNTIAVKNKINKARIEKVNSKLADNEEIDSSQEISTPTLIKKHSFFVRPFETLTKMYGVPSYAEIDPTPFLAITFPILFGLMFGDIGHGFVLVIAGLLGALIFKEKRGKNFYNFCWIIFYCGWGAILAGFLYGEFFGGEYFFTIKLIPLLENPLGSNLTLILWFVILVGVVHINMGWTVQAINYWRQRQRYMAFSDSIIKISLLTGGTILLFFWGFDIESWFRFPYPILLPLIPGLLLLILKPLGKIFRVSYLKKESFGSLMGEGSLEAFETLLSVLSNAASYIRLLALALAHLALLITIEALVNTIPEWLIGREIVVIIVLIFGNILVILLEGLLAFINSLRLHFYEFFFKFYKGSGIEFTPFYLNNQYSEVVFKVEEDIVSEEIEKEIVSKLDESYVMEAKKYLNEKFS